MEEIYGKCVVIGGGSIGQAKDREDIIRRYVASAGL